jgi:hypothetical protein
VSRAKNIIKLFFREENQAAREKKALAKVNRTKTLKFTTVLGSTHEDKPASKRKAAKARHTNITESSATPEPSSSQAHYAYQPAISESASGGSPRPSSISVDSSQHFAEQDDTQSVSDASNYFGYLSSSTTSLQSSVYDPAYTQETNTFPSVPYVAPVNYGMSPALMNNLAPAGYAGYRLPELNHLENKPSSDFIPQQYPQSPLQHSLDHYAAADSPQPSGLCLYISNETPMYPNEFSQYHTSSNPPTPVLPNSYLFPQASPPVYQGPIDWNSRPLAPYHGMPVTHSFHHRPRSHSDQHLYTQTVSMDQICSASV